MPLINNDKWGRRLVRIGPIASIVGVGLALTAAALLIIAVIFLR